jgi:hypothetical protein
MAPSVLLQSSPSPAPYLHPKKQVKVDGATSLEAQAPVNDGLNFRSSSASGNSNTGNGSTNSNEFSRRQQEGKDFVASQSLHHQPLNSPRTQSPGGAAKKPNILYIMADQMAAPHLKMNDPESIIQTPHLDELARTGVVFSSAYCNSPLCAPSRFTMCTGQLPSKIGGYDNASVLGPEVPTYAHYLRREGYETVLAGKMHFIGPDQLHGFEHRSVTSIHHNDLSDLDLIDSLPIYTLATLAGLSSGTNQKSVKSGITTCPQFCKQVLVSVRTS